MSRHAACLSMIAYRTILLAKKKRSLIMLKQSRFSIVYQLRGVVAIETVINWEGKWILYLTKLMTLDSRYLCPLSLKNYICQSFYIDDIYTHCNQRSHPLD